MAYSLQIDNAAHRLFRKLPPDVQEKLIDEAQVLKINPLTGEPLKGKYKAFRSLHLRFKGTNYRIIYQVITKTLSVVIRLATTRENIYRRLDEMKVKPSSK